MIFMIIVLIVVLSVCLLLFLVSPSRRKNKDLDILKGRYIAHRGLHDITGNTPENSLAAFRQAAELGFAVENDIHLTADGEVVVFHDSELERMCGVSGKIEEMTLRELKKLRIAETDCQIPTLKECLEVINGRVPLMIEFKCPTIKCRALCEVADKTLSQYKGDYFIQSFNPMVLWWYRKNRKEVCRGQLATRFKGESLYKRMLGNMLFNFLSRPDFVSYEQCFAKQPMFRLVRRLGAFPVGWTFRSQSELDEIRQSFKSYIFENFIPD